MGQSVFWDGRSARWTGFRSGDTGLGCAVLLAGCDAGDAVPIVQTPTSNKMASSEFTAGWRFGAIGSVSAVKLEALSCHPDSTVLHCLAS